HNIDSCKKPSKGSQHWHELGYENDFAAVSQKQILSEFDPTFGKPHMLAVLQHEPIAKFASHHVADHAADDCSACRHDDDRADIEIVFGPRINRRSEKCGLARHRKAKAFESDDGGNCDYAILVDERGDEMHGLGPDSGNAAAKRMMNSRRFILGGNSQ